MMVFRIAGGLLAVGIFCALFLGSQEGEFTPRSILMMLFFGVVFLAYAIMGPKRLQGLYTRVVGDEEASAAQETQEKKSERER